MRILPKEIQNILVAIEIQKDEYPEFAGLHEETDFIWVKEMDLLGPRMNPHEPLHYMVWRMKDGRIYRAEDWGSYAKTFHPVHEL